MEGDLAGVTRAWQHFHRMHILCFRREHYPFNTRSVDSTKLFKLEDVRARKELARVTLESEINLAGSRRLRSTLVAAPVLYAHCFHRSQKHPAFLAK